MTQQAQHDRPPEEASSLRVEFGRAWIAAPAVWRLDVGGVLDLDAAADGPVDVHVAGRLFARGGAVAVDGRLAVRVSEIQTHTTPQPAALGPG